MLVVMGWGSELVMSINFQRNSLSLQSHMWEIQYFTLKININSAYPHHKRHEEFVIVPGAIAKDVKALVVTRATQLTNRKLHPVIKETECVFVCMREDLWWLWHKHICNMLYLCIPSVWYSRHRAMTVALNALEKSWWSHFFAKIMMGICNQSVISIN